MVKAKKYAGRLYVGLIGFLLYSPLLILIVCSFNDSKIRTVWGGFTLHWYTDLFQNEEVLLAVRTSLILTTSAALIATVIGTLACIAMSVMGKKMKGVMQSVANIPLLKFRDGDRYCHHAVICTFYDSGIYLYAHRPCDYRAALCHIKCHAETAAGGQKSV